MTKNNLADIIPNPPYEFRLGKGGEKVVLHCTLCGLTQQSAYPAQRRKYSVVHGIAVGLGWSATLPKDQDSVDRLSLTCPNCVQLASVKTAVACEAEPAPRITREIIGILEDRFDDKAGVYLNGDSDKTIAIKTGVSIGAVVRIREQFFGKLLASDGVDELRHDIDDLKRQASDLLNNITAAENRLRSYVEKLNR